MSRSVADVKVSGRTGESSAHIRDMADIAMQAKQERRKWGEMGSDCYGVQGFIWGTKKFVLELDSGDGCTTLRMY